MIYALAIAVLGTIDLGALADDGLTDVVAIEEAFEDGIAGAETVHFPAGVYDLVGESGTTAGYLISVSAAADALTITADAGAVLLVACDDEGEHEGVIRVSGAAHGATVTGLEIDAAYCAARILEVLYQNDSAEDVTLTGVDFHGAKQTAGSTNAAGAHLRGGFAAVAVTGSKFWDISTTVACGSGGARGVEVLAYCGASDYRTTDVTITGSVFANITDAAVDGCDSDGVFVQTSCESVPAGTWSVTDSHFANCEYRSIKSQALGGTVSGSTFVRTLRTGHHEIDCQYSDCDVSGNSFFSDGFVASSVVGAAIRDIATVSSLIMDSNRIEYANIAATYPIQAYDLTTAGGSLVDIYVRRNTLIGDATALIYANAPFAGTHLVNADWNQACGAAALLAVPDEAVSVVGVCNGVAC